MPARAALRWAIHAAWVRSSTRACARFEAATRDVATTQSRQLLALIRRNAGTLYGSRHGFARVRSVSDFQDAVPIVAYDDLAPAIEAIARGEARVLTAEPVRLFQPTSGSSTATKLIPWTRGAAAEFQRGISPWIATLYRRRRELARGTSYWSISPPGSGPRRHGCLPVGFDHDAAYLGFFGRALFSLVSASPSGLDAGDMNGFAVRTLVCLLSADRLSLVSVWSPTFLGVLLDHLERHPKEVLAALRAGGHAGAQRAREVEGALLEGGTGALTRVWPHLRVVSCWTHGPSARYAWELARRLPGVEIQGKGLVSTEAFVSLPFAEDRDPTLAVTSHFFELQDLATGRLHLAHDVAVGSTYSVVVTTAGGLYRYRLGDLVEVTGFVGEAPCLRFVGREGNVSDLFGEKLHGGFVGRVIDEALERHGLRPAFCMLAPTTSGPPRYVLFVSEPVHNATSLAAGVESGLQRAFHYAHCRRLGQLGPVGVFQIDASRATATACFQEAMVARGLRAGDVKPVPLDADPSWDRRFGGRILA